MYHTDQLPLVSILVPVYNVAEFIERCTQSLFKQTYKNLEYIFVDDCSADNSIGLLESLCQNNKDKNIRIIHHERNRGLSAARNTALENAKGEWVFCVDSDDFIPHDAIKKLVDKALTDDADVVIGRLALYQNGVYTERIRKTANSNHEHLCLLLSRDTGFSIVCKLVKRSLFTESNIRSIEGIGFGEDFALISRLFYYSKKITYLPEVIYYYEKGNQMSYCHNYSVKSVKELIASGQIVYDFYKNVADSDTFMPSLLIGLSKIRLWILKETNLANKVDLKNVFPFCKGETKTSKITLTLVNRGLYKLALFSFKVLKRLNNG